MSIQVEMTGKEDRQGPWKFAICGFPGTGKTMFSSTAPNALFVFFQESPRIKSIADRHIPHVKITNKLDANGSLAVAVQDQLQALWLAMSSQNHQYETLVFDTGDELFQAMKEARRMKNGGEFGISDWSWIGDAYREIITSFIDLPMNIVVLYHIKTASDDQDGTYRELMLQGAAKDEASGWFDVVGVLDTFETVNDEGDAVTKRVLLTHSSRMYPWLKDHSGALPARFEISNDFVGDFERVLALVTGDEESFGEGSERAVLDELEVPELPEPAETGIPVVAPEVLRAKKAEAAATNTDDDSEAAIPSPEVAAPPPTSGRGKHEKEEGEPADEGQDYVTAEESVPIDSPPDAPAESGQLDQQEPGQREPVEEEEVESADSVAELTEEEAQELLEQGLGATEVDFACAVCGNEVTDEDLRELTQIRFRKYLCRTHFKEELHKSRA